ncbi:hypothetical protein QQS21_004055 [Conoideocrella luteorostrata]|uniref:Mid2 domain-containing protein n=1 Tax=Conoideocrella luteorostrata TaxID=1105319 RepID=A0AAJ0CV55_9HYPO|nr:hypothetical protein QQS21_004055 [Conoideocrella luteorostrata]
MTKQPRGSSLLQARDHLPHSHAHSFFHRFRRNPFHAHESDRTNHSDRVDEHNSEKNFEVKGELDASDGALTKRDPKAITESIVVNAIVGGQDSFITRVVQTISLVQYVDTRGSAFKTQTVYAAPNTVVVDPKSGKTVAISAGTRSTEAHPGSTPGGTRASVSLDTTISTSLDSKSTSTSPAITTKPVLPSVGDARNSTNTPFHANSSLIAPTNNSSIYKQLLYSSPVSLPTSETQSTTSKCKTTETTNFLKYTQSTQSTQSSSSTYLTHPSHSTTSPGDEYGTLTVAGGIPTSTPSSVNGSSEGGGGVTLTPQQKQVIGGVVGAVAGVAVIGLLLMLFLRYKKRKGGRIMLDSQSGITAARILGDGTPGGGSGAAMAERSRASGAVAAALANLTGNKPPPIPQSTESGERGFYRVSGRKLPSVLHTGGDGYSDPRESAASGSSDYYRGSQAFDPGSRSVGQLALGAPMRPISGVPVMRSGPARVPITENPFADPEPPTTPTNLSSRSVGSPESPQASGSRFQERI